MFYDGTTSHAHISARRKLSRAILDYTVQWLLLLRPNDKISTYTIEVNSPGLAPETQSIKLTFESNKCIKLPILDQLDIINSTEMDLVHVMGSALDCGKT